MQVHGKAQAAPVLGEEGIKKGHETHAKPCTLGMHGLNYKKWRDF